MPREALRCVRCRADKAKVFNYSNYRYLAIADDISVLLALSAGLRGVVFAVLNTITHVLPDLSSPMLNQPYSKRSMLQYQPICFQY